MKVFKLPFFNNPSLNQQAVLIRALTHPHAFWYLLGLAFIVISAGIGLRDPWPADEPRFALVAKHMVETGQWLFPVRGFELYADKPPLFMWALALCYALTGSMRLAFLLPSLLAALLTIGLIVDLTRRLWNQATAIVCGLMLLCMLQFTLQARTAQIDALLCAWVTLSLYGFWRHCVLGPAWRWYAIGGFAAGLGVITKGIGVIAYVFFIPYCLARWQSSWSLLPATRPSIHRLEWRWSLAPLMTLLAVALWLLPMLLYVEQHATPELLAYRDNILFRQTAERYLRPWHHHQPFWYFLVKVIPWAWFPVTLILPWMLVFISRKLKARDTRYLLASGLIVLILIFFSLSAGKREVYILPATPWVAMLAAAFVMERTLPKIVHLLSLGLLALVSLLALYAMAAPNQLLEMTNTQMTTVAWWELRLMALIISISAAALIFFPKTISPGYRLSLLLAVFWLSLGWLAYPALNAVRSSKPMMQTVASIVGTHEVAILQWREQYLLFAPDNLRLKYFAYQNPLERDILQGKAWLAESKSSTSPALRYLLIPEAVLPHCQTSTNHPPIALGIYHRRAWWLVSQC